ncbi:MAG: hypothetical protein KDK62_06420 [Chlamydiia bacterium]|nr:hypothetical protein [Chlamydiia bacterium]
MWRFKCLVAGVLMLFIGLLVFVTLTAYTRKSGNTGLDMAKIHLLRLNADK